MKNSLGRGAAVLGILALGALGARAEEPLYDYPMRSEDTPKTAQATILDWPAYSRLAARALIEKYGDPVRFDDDRLVWSETGPWSRIVVSRDAPRGLFARGGRDVVEQSIWYFVPDDKIAELQRFDDRLTWDMPTGQLSSRAESEELNFLALNLADEIVDGKRTPEDARDFYRKTIALSESGKSSPYMSGIIFILHVPPH